MSKVIDTSDPTTLSADDIRYLAERGQLPPGVENPIKDPQRMAVGDMVHTGDANTLAVSTEQLEAELARRRKAESEQAEKNLVKDQEELRREKAGTLAAQDDDDEDGKPYTYADKSDDELQAILSQRGLSTEGTRKTMRRRLVEDDAGKKE